METTAPFVFAKEVTMAVLVILIGLYLIGSSICVSYFLKDGTIVDFKTFIFGILALPVIIVWELWNEYKE